MSERSTPPKRPAAFLRRYCVPILTGIFVLAIAVNAGYLLVAKFRRQAPVVAVAPVPAVLPKPAPQLKEITGTFKPNQTVTEALVENGLSSQGVYEMVESTRPVYNLARVKAQQPYWLCLTPEGEFHDFRYQIDEENVLDVRQQGDQFVPRIEPIPYETRVETVSGVIEDSLFASMIDAGEEDRLALDLADIFGSDIDFYTDIQKGDSYRMLVEKKYLNGEFKIYGSILAATIRNQNKELTGLRFHDGMGKAAYYAPDGKALKKSFLKSPLKFARITSRFTMARMHPILKIVRPHLGVDYAAPTGTPVQAVGSGIVLMAGMNGQGGKSVRLRHSGSYETMYMHLSRIAVRRGARVSQGEVIGYVGATGLATGPHLDFRIWYHGKPLNPAKVIFPPAPPVPASDFAEFAQLRDRLMGRLDQLAE